MKENTPEATPKFFTPEKSKILNQFGGVALQTEPCQQGPTQKGRTCGHGAEMAQKGDFAGMKNFGVASTVLSRRYRPQCFSDVVGQQAILQTLKNGLRKNHLAHAYLFSGSRGTGKTTLARLFAKALNCTSLKEEEPCGQCSSCLDILSGQSLDVIEIDGASNRGIDDIRQINETVAFAPSHGKYKIYIIDEVHMLTKEAFNALLKTLEEPPEKVKFFFATTEPHKVPSTILSRCQRFDLSRLIPSQIVTKLSNIANDLGRDIEMDALYLLAQYADGSLRDAESLLDQILCFSEAKITSQEVRGALGLVPQELFFTLDQAFKEERLEAAFTLVEEIFTSGKDLAHFLTELIEHYRNIAVVKMRGEAALNMPPTLSSRYAASANLYSQPQSLWILDLLLKAEAQFSRQVSPRTALEITLLQILRTKHRIPIEALIRRLSEMEETISAKEQAVEPIALQESPPLNPELSLSSVENKSERHEPHPEPHSDLQDPALKGQGLLPEDQELEEKAKNGSKHPSYYATLMRFAAVELEGTIKN